MFVSYGFLLRRGLWYLLLQAVSEGARGLTRGHPWSFNSIPPNGKAEGDLSPQALT